MLSPAFRDRADAGRQLAVRVAPLVDATRVPHTVIVLGLPRGGVPVAYEVAKLLGAPLDVLPVRKLALPGAEEVAVGAIAAVNGDPVQVLDGDLFQARPDAHLLLEYVLQKEMTELDRRRRRYRGAKPPLHLTGCDVVLVDDGLATGSTMRAAIRAVRDAHARRVIVAVPVAASSSLADVGREADAFTAVVETPSLLAVGMWYDDFTPTSDKEVSALLEDAERQHAHRLTSGVPA